MMLRGIPGTGPVVLLCLAVCLIFGGCGGDKSTSPPLTGACCTAAGTCSVTTQAACVGSWQGANTACAPNPCPQPTGACCATAGTCSVTTQVACAGTWGGAGTACLPNPCPQPPTGACCNAANCSVTTQASCGGSWQGANTACAPNPCVSTTTGTIMGTAGLPIGVPGDISNTLVSIYADYADWNNYRPLRSVASTYISPSQISFTFTNVTPGTYYLDCWKDNDLSGRWSFGDFLGVYGSTVWPGPVPAPLSVIGGQTTTVTVIVIGIGN